MLGSLATRLRLDDRVAVITGAGAGIGRGIALALVEQGARVALLDRDLDAARRVATELHEAGCRALAVRCDVSAEAQVIAAVAHTVEQLGAPAILVNAAGVVSSPGLPFTNNTEADWDQVLAVNVKGMFFTAKAMAPHLNASGAGRVVNIASITGLIAAPYMPPYSVSKAAVISLTKVLARDFAPLGTTVNAVCPGFVWTPLWEQLGRTMAEASAGGQGHDARAVFDERVRTLVPMQRPQTVEDVADAVAFLCSPAAAQTKAAWPTRPITIVVAYPPGTPGDVTIRSISDRLTTSLKQPVIIENRPGAAGNIGAESVLRAPADGHTFLEGPDGIFTINPHIYKRLGFKPDDFQPVTVLVNFSQMLVCNPGVPAKSVSELTDLARKQMLTYASGGAGAPGHLVMEMYLSRANVSMTHVPYKGPSPATQDLLGAQVPCGFLTTNVVAPHVKAGRLTGLAISGRKRSVLVPEVPTMQEAGVADFDATFGEALYAHRDVPAEIVRRMQEEVAKALAAPEVRQKLLAMDLEPSGIASADVSRRIRGDFEKWGAVARKISLTLD